MIGSEGENHYQNCDLICGWIQKKIKGFFANREIGQFKDLKVVFSSLSVFPNVAMYTDKAGGSIAAV